jgi:hypothetical protein
LGTNYSNNFSLSTQSGDDALIVPLSFEGDPGTITAPTWDGVSMTQIGGTYHDAADDIYIAIFGLLAPDIGTHLTLAASWTNNVYYNYGFFPLSGVSQTSFATSFTDYSEPSNSPPNPDTGTDATAGASVQITDSSANPTSDLNMAFVGNAGGSLNLSSGQTDFVPGGNPGNNDTWDIAYGAGKSSDTYTFTGSLARNWAVEGITVNAPSSSPTGRIIRLTGGLRLIGGVRLGGTSPVPSGY